MTRLSPSLVLTLSVTCGACYQHARPDAPGQVPKNVRSETAALPPGTFTRGDMNGEPDEYPEQQVTVKAFRIERTEVTNESYGACVDAKACARTPFADHETLGRPDHPVVGASWEDAVSYCTWIGRRLPTEAEWEYAARGSDLRKWPWSGVFVEKRANTRGDDFHPMTAPVTAYPDGSSPFGVLNLAGNAAEWVADYYGPLYYRQSETMIDPVGPETGRERVVRGGSYTDTHHESRVSARKKKLPTEIDATVGFRCAEDD